MTLNPNIQTTDVDALSPLDDYLMGAIRTNLSNLDDQINGTGSKFFPVIQFKLNGPLDLLTGGKLRRADTAFITTTQVFSSARLYLDEPGISGTLEADLRLITTPNVAITGIEPQYLATTQAIGRAGSSLSTQSITRTTVQIATQSITQWKASLNVLSIVNVGTNLWQYNLSAAPDSDWIVGDSVTFASCTSVGNNGTFTIVRVNDYGSSSIIVSNASGVVQNGSAGTATLKAFAYNFANPVSTEFSAGELALFQSHSNAANNGTLTIYAINSAGNNIVVKNASGATQGSVAGTVDVLRFSYNLSSAAAAADYVVGDTLNASSHSNAGNNGNFKITGVNKSGNNLQVYNSAGVIQGSAAGSVASNQWVYSMPTNPTGSVSVGDEIYCTGHSTSANDGTFTVRQVNRAAVNNVVIHNVNGAAQAGTGGTLAHANKLIKFASDQSSKFIVGSWIEVSGSSFSVYNTTNSYDLGFAVTQVNRGGGANYNVVVKVSGTAAAQYGGAGWVSLESRSVLSSTLKITMSPDGTRTIAQSKQQAVSSSVTAGTVTSGSKIALYILSVPSIGASGVMVAVQ